MTKQFAMELLEKFQAMQRGEIPLTGDTTMEKLPELIEYYAELARTAPDENDRIPAEVTFQSDATGFYDTFIKGYAEVDGKKIHTRISNASTWQDEAIFYLNRYGDVNNCDAIPIAQMEDPVEVTITEEKATQMGDALMKELGLENAVCDQITAVAFEEYQYGENLGVIDASYEMEYDRTVNGFPIAYSPYDGTATPENETYIGSWAYESITVYVSENGIVYFNWTNPYTEPVIQTEDTQILSFSDVADIFAKMIIVKNSDLKAQNTANGFNRIKNIDISDVRLSLMRIRSKDTLWEGLLVPVWDFWGTVSCHAADSAYSDMVYDGEEYTVALTVNAIDGTIIDREVGY